MIAASTSARQAASELLQQQAAGVRVHFTWFGVSRAMADDHKQTLADAFEADAKVVSGSRKLIDTKDLRYKACTKVRSQARTYVKDATLPYPEPGIRLLPRSALSAFSEAMTGFSAKLAAAVDELAYAYPSIIADMRQRLGSLFDRTLYPDSIRDQFDLTFDFPSLTPPEYLVDVNAALYEQECERVRSRFADAVDLANQAFTQELSGLVSGLIEKLVGDGTGREVRPERIEGFITFFERFRSLSVGGNETLDSLVAECRQLVLNGTPSLLAGTAFREGLAAEFAKVSEGLDAMLVDKPKRRIRR